MSRETHIPTVLNIRQVSTSTAKKILLHKEVFSDLNQCCAMPHLFSFEIQPNGVKKIKISRGAYPQLQKTVAALYSKDPFCRQLATMKQNKKSAYLMFRCIDSARGCQKTYSIQINPDNISLYSNTKNHKHEENCTERCLPMLWKEFMLKTVKLSPAMYPDNLFFLLQKEIGRPMTKKERSLVRSHLFTKIRPEAMVARSLGPVTSQLRDIISWADEHMINLHIDSKNPPAPDKEKAHLPFCLGYVCNFSSGDFSIAFTSYFALSQIIRHAKFMENYSQARDGYFWVMHGDGTTNISTKKDITVLTLTVPDAAMKDRCVALSYGQGERTEKYWFTAFCIEKAIQVLFPDPIGKCFKPTLTPKKELSDMFGEKTVSKFPFQPSPELNNVNYSIVMVSDCQVSCAEGVANAMGLHSSVDCSIHVRNAILDNAEGKKNGGRNKMYISTVDTKIAIAGLKQFLLVWGNMGFPLIAEEIWCIFLQKLEDGTLRLKSNEQVFTCDIQNDFAAYLKTYHGINTWGRCSMPHTDIIIAGKTLSVSLGGLSDHNNSLEKNVCGGLKRHLNYARHCVPNSIMECFNFTHRRSMSDWANGFCDSPDYFAHITNRDRFKHVWEYGQESMDDSILKTFVLQTKLQGKILGGCNMVDVFFFPNHQEYSEIRAQHQEHENAESHILSSLNKSLRQFKAMCWNTSNRRKKFYEESQETITENMTFFKSFYVLWDKPSTGDQELAKSDDFSHHFCTCTTGLKYGFCRQILCLSLWINGATFPDIMKNMPIGSTTRKLGRPKQSKRKRYG